MNKQNFIALADLIRGRDDFTPAQIEALAGFCRAQNNRFNEARWLGYIQGTNGPNGGAK